MSVFQPWEKISRLSRDMVVTEKIDGTNAAINVLTFDEAASLGVTPEQTTASLPDTVLVAQSRTRVITPADDNFGFARYVVENAEAIAQTLGYGLHFGEWWGQGIQRRYGIKEKQFSLFNTSRWGDVADSGCPYLSVVPTLYNGPFDVAKINEVMETLKESGSVAAPGFMNPEGVVIYHTQARVFFKKTFEKDDAGKEHGA